MTFRYNLLAIGPCLAVLAVFMIPTLSARPPLQAELEACAAQERNTDRLRCFERLTDLGRKPAATAIVESGAESGAESGVESGAESAATPAPAALASQPVPAPEAAGQIAPAPEAAGQIAPAPALPGADKPAQAAADLGQEQLPPPRRDAPDESATLGARVIEVSQHGRSHLYFHLENGQVWRQIEPRYVPYPRNGAFEVEISRGMLGEYRLRVAGKGRLVRIRRVK